MFLFTFTVARVSFSSVVVRYRRIHGSLQMCHVFTVKFKTQLKKDAAAACHCG